MKLLQINLNRRKMVQDLMLQYVVEYRPDIVIISEPNRQLPFWYNDTKGDASIWVTLLNGRLPDESTIIKKEEVAGICVGNIFCISGYCSLNLKQQEYLRFINTFARLIKDGTSSNRNVIVVGDFNAKSMCWGSVITDKRDRVLMETLCEYGVFTLRHNHTYGFFLQKWEDELP
jgi:hypothetical protein